MAPNILEVGNLYIPKKNHLSMLVAIKFVDLFVVQSLQPPLYTYVGSPLLFHKSVKQNIRALCSSTAHISNQQ
jgi:hypothetical protein